MSHGFRTGFEQLIVALAGQVRACYGPSLWAFVVFGSVARGVPRPDSDLDCLIVADPLPAGRVSRVVAFEAGVEDPLAPALVSLRSRFGISPALSPIIKTPAEVAAGSPLFLDMVEASDIRYDREGFFAGYLASLGQRLLALGARKVALGSAWYWLLTPSLVPGEVIEL
ncbi:MAG: nucleotidyltransferase domain-containing protein [Thermodesulfobacteriota bacterium]